MTTRRTDVGREAEAALGEVLAHVRGTSTASLPNRRRSRGQAHRGRYASE